MYTAFLLHSCCNVASMLGSCCIHAVMQRMLNSYWNNTAFMLKIIPFFGHACHVTPPISFNTLRSCKHEKLEEKHAKILCAFKFDIKIIHVYNRAFQHANAYFKIKKNPHQIDCRLQICHSYILAL